MLSSQYLILNNLYYHILSTDVQFEKVSFTFKKERYGVVGANGAGKSTLLKLIANLIQPTQGHVVRKAQIAYCPQYFSPSNLGNTVADVLELNSKLKALARVREGFCVEADFDEIGEDWDLDAKIENLLQLFKLPISMHTPYLSLSGGQKTKVLLIKMMLSNADFILLDEPSNNLDTSSKAILMNWIQTSEQGFLIASHDRVLLNSMEHILDITKRGIDHYGGDYAFYQAQKKLRQNALQHQHDLAQQQLKQFAKDTQATLEKHEQRKKKGNHLRKDGKVDKITADLMKNRSDKTASRNITLKNQRLKQANTAVDHTKSQLEINESIHADLTATQVHQGKIILNIDQLTFTYTDGPLLFQDFNLQLLGPERIALQGVNGSGKSTLVRLIMNELKPTAGSIYLGTPLVQVLNQTCDFLNNDQTLIENFTTINQDMTHQEIHSSLASFQFRNVDALKRIAHLSGGERIRAGLAMRLLSKKPPQLIILDEPTNHLDIKSIESIEQALALYQGALIVISHDASFLKNIGISRTILLN